MREMLEAEKVDAQRVIALEVGIGRGANVDARSVDLELAGSATHRGFLVTGAQQVGFQVARAQRFAHVDAARSGIDARGVLKNLAAQPLGDQWPNWT